MKVFGIDPGSERTGYGCVETDGSRHRLVACGAIVTSPRNGFPEQLLKIHQQLNALLADCRPECVAIESVFYAVNVRSALKLGHARGVAVLAAVEGGYPVVEYTPAEVKRAVVGYGRAEKHQVGEMVRLLLGLTEVPTPDDAADALAVAICHLHSQGTEATRGVLTSMAASTRGKPRSWRDYRPEGEKPGVRSEK
ncbi:MAG TPA: crossover junction endodeoxyribonuclease RuvC [Vicinamibacterales bacterium]